MQNLLPRSALITFYKAFRPHLHFGDILYDQAHTALFHKKLESLQYNACLAITGAINGSLTEKLYQELDFESLQQRCWYRKLCGFYKIFKTEIPHYLFNVILTRNRSYITTPIFHCLNLIIIFTVQKTYISKQHADVEIYKKARNAYFKDKLKENTVNSKKIGKTLKRITFD